MRDYDKSILQGPPLHIPDIKPLQEQMFIGTFMRIANGPDMTTKKLILGMMRDYDGKGKKAPINHDGDRRREREYLNNLLEIGNNQGIK